MVVPAYDKFSQYDEETNTNIPRHLGGGGGDFFAPIRSSPLLEIRSTPFPGQFQPSLTLIVTPSEFVVVTCFTREPFIATDGKAVRVFSLSSDPFSINSFLVTVGVSLFAFNYACTFKRSSLTYDSVLFTSLSAI